MWKHGKNKKLNVVFSVLLAFLIITGLIIASIPEQSTKDYTPIISDKTNTKTTELQESNITTTKEVTTTNKTIRTTKKTTSTYKTTTAEPIELNFTQLYLDFFEPYINSIDELMPETFRQANIEKFANYDVQITEGNEEDMWKFEISDSNGNSVYMSFYPTNDIYENPSEDWVETLTLLTYNSNNKEISISDNCHLYSEPIYNTYDKNRSIPNQEVKNLDELKKFMFSVSMKLSETETTTTTTSQPITELPAETTETEPPPPLEPVQPEIAESNYVLNTSTMKVHKPNCHDVEKIVPENRWDYYGTIEDIQSMGYSACGHCHAW